MSVTELQQHDRFVVRQLIKPMINVYRVTAGDDPKNPGPLMAFVRQKRLAFKEQISVFADENSTQLLFQIKARKVVEIGGSYDVTAADGTPIGVLEKQFKKSLVRSTWCVRDSERERADAGAGGQRRDRDPAAGQGGLSLHRPDPASLRILVHQGRGRDRYVQASDESPRSVRSGPVRRHQQSHRSPPCDSPGHSSGRSSRSTKLRPWL